ncbi:hypothetical protein LJC52_03225 [Bacteroidales bacterium OttesenSCG-928-A17]|nr:hypothetical protein [Bacteroidales bacterium OttesenSCG-928-A17]
MTSFQQQIDELRKQMDNLEKTMIDSLNQIRSGLKDVERAHLNLIQEQPEKAEECIPEVKEFIPEEQEEAPVVIVEEELMEEQEPEIPEDLPIPGNIPSAETKIFLSDAIVKEKLTDFRKSLSLNDRFMFQRDIFQNNVDEMNQTLEMLNRFDNLNDALNFLNSNYPIQWESEAGITFRELLEKRFL